MPTVAQINEKITDLRSKIAVTECVMLYLKTNYLSSKDGKGNEIPPEMRITRGDYGMVPETHINSTLVDYVDYIDQLKMELEEWEQMTVQLPEPRVVAKEPATDKIVKKKKETANANAAGSKHQDNPAPKPCGSAKAG